MLRQISFGALVHAPFDALWEILLDRIEHPQEYIPGAEGVQIIERSDDFWVREVRARGLVLREQVTVDKGKGEICYTLLEHPLFSGTVTQRVVPASRQSPVAPVHLSMVVDWVPKNEDAEKIIIETMPSEIQQEVLSIKEKAEMRPK